MLQLHDIRESRAYQEAMFIRRCITGSSSVKERTSGKRPCGVK